MRILTDSEKAWIQQPKKASSTWSDEDSLKSIPKALLNKETWFHETIKLNVSKSHLYKQEKFLNFFTQSEYKISFGSGQKFHSKLIII